MARERKTEMHGCGTNDSIFFHGFSKRSERAREREMYIVQAHIHVYQTAQLQTASI